MTGLTRMRWFANNSGDERALHGVMSSALRHAMTHIWTLSPEGCNRRRSWHQGSLRDTPSIFSVRRTRPREERTQSGRARGGGPRDPRLLKVPGGGSCGGRVGSRSLREGVWCERHWASTRPHSAPRHGKGEWSSHKSVLRSQHKARVRTRTRACLTRAQSLVFHSHSLKCCAHTQRAHARQHNTKLPRVRGAAVSVFKCSCEQVALSLPPFGRFRPTS